MPLIGACCELSRCEPVKARVGSIGVVVDPPCFDDLPRFVEIAEQVLVEASVPQTAVELSVSRRNELYPKPGRLRGSRSQRPPKHTRFSPGRSGNPKGRPRRQSSTAQLLLEVLQERRTVTENGVSKRMSVLQLMYKVLVANALKGHARHSAQLFKLISDLGLLEEPAFQHNTMIIKLVRAQNSDKDGT